jgi:FolB domain-containing protein
VHPVVSLILREITKLSESNLVRICFDELLIDVYLGAHAVEQEQRRTVPVYLEFEYEQPHNDSLAEAIDYRGIRDKVFAAVANRRFRLVETLAQTILDAIKTEHRIVRILVKVSKTKALKQAQSVDAVYEWRRHLPIERLP